MSWLETFTGPLEQKRQYRQAMARINALPASHRKAAEALVRYLQYQGGIVDGDSIVTMVGDLADLWERAATDGAGVRDIVGDDPVGFADDFAAAYVGKRWMDKERARLVKAIDEAEGDQRS